MIDKGSGRMAGSRPHPRDLPDDESTIILTSRYDRESELQRLREIAERVSPQRVRELFYDSKSGVIFARMRHELNGEPSPLSDYAVRVWLDW
jgi:hypothetical protein